MNRNARPSYEFGPFRLDPSEHLLLKHGQPVVLTPKVFQVLRVLVQNAGHLVEKDRLLTEVWADSLRPGLTELLGPPAATDHAPPPTGDPSAAERAAR